MWTGVIQSVLQSVLNKFVVVNTANHKFVLTATVNVLVHGVLLPACKPSLGLLLGHRVEREDP